MQKKILVPVDLANDTPAELEFACDLARLHRAKLLLVHVVDYVPTVLPIELPAGFPTPQLDVVRASAERKLAEMAKGVQGLEVETHVEVGAAAHEIVQVAEREGVDQIVMGSHRHGAIARMFLGSVAERVARTAACPVTIVREPR